mmetsp:Transcript_17193/g.54260  ORF Transcript_17193/g.54260 Transcript_17193/m.54260 type:complete len:207 (-) Transcript_17193:2-622(-)
MSKVEYSAPCFSRMAMASLENLQKGSVFEPFMKSITGEKLMSCFSRVFRSWLCAPGAPAPPAQAPLQAPPPAPPPQVASKGLEASCFTFSTSLGGSAPASTSTLPPRGFRKAAKGTWSAPREVARLGQTSVLTLAKPTSFCSAAMASRTFVRCTLGGCQGAQSSTVERPLLPSQKAFSSASEETSATAAMATRPPGPGRGGARWLP